MKNNPLVVWSNASRCDLVTITNNTNNTNNTNSSIDLVQTVCLAFLVWVIFYLYRTLVRLGAKSDFPAAVTVAVSSPSSSNLLRRRRLRRPAPEQQEQQQHNLGPQQEEEQQQQQQQHDEQQHHQQQRQHEEEQHQRRLYQQDQEDDPATGRRIQQLLEDRFGNTVYNTGGGGGGRRRVVVPFNTQEQRRRQQRRLNNNNNYCNDHLSYSDFQRKREFCLGQLERNVVVVDTDFHNIIETIASRNWKAVLAWITFHPDELRYSGYLDRKQQTALHHAILFRAPTHILEMMLFQAPELAVWNHNPDSELPLHWAVRVGAPNPVIELLLNAHPTSGVAAKDKEGNTPLSILWERQQDQFEQEQIQRQRTRRQEEGEDDEDEEVDSLAFFHSNGWKRLEIVLRSYHEYVNKQQLPNSTTTTTASATSEVEEQSDDTLSKTTTSPTTSPLHLVSSCPCPPSLFRFVYRLYSSTNATRVPDEEGRIPLTLACFDASANLWGSSKMIEDSDDDNYVTANSSRSDVVSSFSKIQFLVSVDPKAASMRDHATGRIPLFWALQVGISWNEGISDFVAAHPKSILFIDPLTGLYPFQLAAAGCSEPVSSSSSPRCCCCSFDDDDNDDGDDDSNVNDLQPQEENKEEDEEEDGLSWRDRNRPAPPRARFHCSSLSTIYRLLRYDPGRQIARVVQKQQTTRIEKSSPLSRYNNP